MMLSSISYKHTQIREVKSFIKVFLRVTNNPKPTAKATIASLFEFLKILSNSSALNSNQIG